MRLIDADKLQLQFLSNVQEYNSLNVRLTIERQPTEDAKMISHGKWIMIGSSILCSICNCSNGYRSDFCPNCGATMDEKGGK